MKITCQNCEQVLSEYLCNIPFQWRGQIAKAICDNLNSQQTLECKQVKNCETVTTLSAFSINGTEICITYRDEDDVSYERCFDWENIQNATLDNVDPKCITSQELWDIMTFPERIQAIIDYACTCTQVTTTTTSTTTTTTIL